MPHVKRCKQCGISKNILDFTKATSNKDGFATKCKICKAEYSRNYTKTLTGKITQIYNSQKASSKQRNHPPPDYSKKELAAWMHAHGYQQLHLNWKKQGYLKQLAPSIDRLDDTTTYSLSNIRLVTWGTNNDTAYAHRKAGKMVTKQVRKINQLSQDGHLLQTYASISLASRISGICRTHINSTCRGKHNLAGGYRWQYASP